MSATPKPAGLRALCPSCGLWTGAIASYGGGRLIRHYVGGSSRTDKRCPGSETLAEVWHENAAIDATAAIEATESERRA